MDDPLQEDGGENKVKNLVGSDKGREILHPSVMCKTDLAWGRLLVIKNRAAQ